MSDLAFALTWIPVTSGAVGFYDSEQTALREATAEIDWLNH